MRHNPTIKDIAKELGISKSTVSRALSGHPNVRRETRTAVQDMAAAMRYNGEEPGEMTGIFPFF